MPSSGHPPYRRQPEPGKITRKGGRRPSRVTRSALARDLARLHTGAPGGWPALAARALGVDRCGAEPVRRAAGTTRAPTPPWPGGPKSGRRRPGAQRFPAKGRPMIGGSCAAFGSALIAAALATGSGQPGPGALRAPLKTLEKVLTAWRAAWGCAWGCARVPSHVLCRVRLDRAVPPDG
jgi:hypothetical protein